MNEITNKDSNPNSSCNFHSSTNENPGGFFLVFVSLFIWLNFLLLICCILVANRESILVYYAFCTQNTPCHVQTNFVCIVTLYQFIMNKYVYTKYTLVSNC